MAASTDLTDLANVKEALEVSGTDDDDYLTALIGRASESIENYCDREFAAQDITEEFDGTGSKYYILKQYPVNSVSNLYVRSGDLDDDEWDELESDNYTYYDGEGKLYFSGGFNRGPKNYKVVYNAGFTTIPNDLEQATIQLISHYYNKRTGSDIESESIGDYSVKYKSVEKAITDLGIDVILDSYINYKA